MLRTLVLLVATLAVVALAAPAPKVQRSVSSWNFGSKHSFKSSTRGHRGHRDPRTEISRIYNKFQWSTSKFSWSITLPLTGTTVSFGYGSGSSTDSPYNIPDGSSSYPDGSDSSPLDAPASTVSSYIVASQYSSEAPATYATETYAIVAPSSQAVDVSTFATHTSTAASATSTANAPEDGGSGEVTATPEPNESEYLSPVSIGGQSLNLNFDTGSADL
jgi:hypothetical protein